MYDFDDWNFVLVTGPAQIVGTLPMDVPLDSANVTKSAAFLVVKTVLLSIFGTSC